MAAVRFFVFCACLFCLVEVCCAQKRRGDRCTDSLKRDGICIRLSNCPYFEDKSESVANSSNCGRLPAKNRPPRGRSLVCCPSIKFEPSDPPDPELFKQPGERAKYWCNKYGRACRIYNSLPHKIIAGGTPSLPNEFPHMAAVGFGLKHDIKWFCGGSLISNKFVLTAAHCLSNFAHGPAKWVLLGTVNLPANESFLDNDGQIHPVVRRLPHPGYKSSEKYNDIALLEIGQAFTENPTPLDSLKLHPACLGTDQSIKYHSMIAAGWGRVGHFEDPSNHLLKVELDVFDEAECNETFEAEIRTTSQLKRGIDSTMICAGVLSGGKDTCQGDSGGPLQVSSNSSCQYTIWGITSFGKFCAFPDSPSLFTKISAYIEWIENEVWPL